MKQDGTHGEKSGSRGARVPVHRVNVRWRGRHGVRVLPSIPALRGAHNGHPPSIRRRYRYPSHVTVLQSASSGGSGGKDAGGGPKEGSVRHHVLCSVQLKVGTRKGRRVVLCFFRALENADFGNLKPPPLQLQCWHKFDMRGGHRTPRQKGRCACWCLSRSVSSTR